MELSNEKLELIEKAFKEKGISKKCNECKSEEHSIVISDFYLFSQDRAKGIKYFPIICKNCGAVKLFNLYYLIGAEEANKQ